VSPDKSDELDKMLQEVQNYAWCYTRKTRKSIMVAILDKHSKIFKFKIMNDVMQ
jgi:hypothetical protein